MLNHIWFAMIALAIIIAAGNDLYNELLAPQKEGVAAEQAEKRNLNEETKLGRVTTAALEGAGTAVEIAIGLIGIMALWLGVMKVAEDLFRFTCKITTLGPNLGHIDERGSDERMFFPKPCAQSSHYVFVQRLGGIQITLLSQDHR